MLSQALNKKPQPQPEEAPSYKLVRCFQVPATVKCYRSSEGAAWDWDRCETVMERQCYLYTYTINTDQ